MKILLDENMPEKLLQALRSEGHSVESIHTLGMKGATNGAVIETASKNFDLCFTNDADFAARVRQMKDYSTVKVLRVQIKQKPQEEYIKDFVTAFRKTDWSEYKTGDGWPKQSR